MSEEQKPDILKKLSDVVINLQEGVIKAEDWNFLHIELYEELEKSLKRDEHLKEIEQLFRERIRIWGRVSLSEKESQEVLKKLEGKEG